eukprot:GCRY01000494.1.p1 GENE.GCRY01000494.1~~GCRY01000494.1.p1  ORF type:complete len:377 (+),score=59.48 GCRY01000494.1:58-1188(+)
MGDCDDCGPLSIASKGWDEIVKMLRCFVACACIGMILIIVGLVIMLSAAKDTRGDKLDEFNAGVELWNLEGRKAFEGFSSVYVVPPSSVTLRTAANLTADSSTETDYDDGHPEDLDPYTPLRYDSGSLNNLFADGPLAVADSQGTLTFYLTKNLVTSRFTVSVNLFDTEVRTPSTVPCKTSSSTKKKSSSSTNTCPSKCSDLGGVWNSATERCTIKKYVTDVCVKVSPTANGGFALNRTYGDVGCGYDTGFNPAYKMATTEASSVSLSPTVTVRSALDPLILAQYLTDGDMDFGLTRAEKLILGGILFGIGFVIMAVFAFCGLFVYHSFKKKDRNDTDREQQRQQQQQDNQPGVQPPAYEETYSQPSYGQGGGAPM